MDKTKGRPQSAFALSAATEKNEISLTLSAPGKLPIVNERITLTIGLSPATLGVPPSPLTTDYKDNYFTKFLERETGVNLEFVLFPSDNAEALQKLAAMISAGEKLPDIVALPGISDIAMLAYGESGVFLPLGKYFASSAYYWNRAMDAYTSPEEKANVLKYATSPDGNIYSYPAYAVEPGDATALGMWLNKTWLGKLGLGIPTTTQELRDMLVAFRDQDANGNGDPSDEIPLIGHTGWVGDVRLLLMNAFIYDAFAPAYHYQLNVTNGALWAPFVTDAYREGLRYLRGLYKEGLISPDSLTITTDELREINSRPNDQATLVGAFVGHPRTVISYDGTVQRIKEYVGVPPMIGPEGVQWTPYAGQLGFFCGSITRDCKYPELAFRVMDAVAREDISISVVFGEQGVDWKYVAEGEDEGEANHKFLSNAPIFAVINDLLRVKSNKVWHGNYFRVSPPKLTGGMVVKPVSELYDYQLRTLWLSTVPYRYYRHPDEVAIKLLFTREEFDRIGEIEAALRSYVDASLTRFISGELDVEGDWDSYLNSLETMGIQRYLETAQRAYDRMKSW